MVLPEGDLVEYAPGEKYQTFEGVTAGELIPGDRVRMFYFYPERGNVRVAGSEAG